MEVALVSLLIISIMFLLIFLGTLIVPEAVRSYYEVKDIIEFHKKEKKDGNIR